MQSTTICIWATVCISHRMWQWHDDVIKWKQFPRYWPFARWLTIIIWQVSYIQYLLACQKSQRSTPYNIVKMAFLESGFSAVTILGGGWLQSPASDGPPWFVRGIYRSPVISPHKGQWRGALMFSLIRVWINGCVNNSEVGDLRRHGAHYGVIVMETIRFCQLAFRLLIKTSLIMCHWKSTKTFMLISTYVSFCKKPCFSEPWDISQLCRISGSQPDFNCW